MKAKILLLEDDEILAETLIDLLKAKGFEVVHVKSGEEALEATFDERFDIFVFDVNVPHIDGFELLKNLRQGENETPTIFITARTDISSLAYGFEVGADDYLKKPFDFEELLIRIEALLRRAYHAIGEEIKIGDFIFHTKKSELYKNEKFIPLAPAELKIAKLLFQNRNVTVAKEELLEAFADGKEASEGALRVYITKLRKIGLPIRTIKGGGYRLEGV